MAADHTSTDAFRGATFSDADLAGATFRDCSLQGARITGSDISGLRISGYTGSGDGVVVGRAPLRLEHRGTAVVGDAGPR